LIIKEETSVFGKKLFVEIKYLNELKTKGWRKLGFLPYVSCVMGFFWLSLVYESNKNFVNIKGKSGTDEELTAIPSEICFAFHGAGCVPFTFNKMDCRGLQ
jgi:hypothetical protein